MAQERTTASDPSQRPETPNEPEPGDHEAEDAPAAEVEPAPSRARVLRGTTVSPGMVLGTVHRKDYDLSRVGAERVPLDQVDSELNRLRRGLDESREQLRDLKARLQGRVQADDARILDTHIAYLKDSVFVADVENLILNEQMRLEAAIAKVVADFDRIFRLVQNAPLRQSAVDLRDVGIRVLRNLERHAAEAGEAPPRDYILVARELSIVDMFNLTNEHVKGIATREGGLTSHAAIFARSMGIPTITGVEGLLDEVQEGDFVILDATEGVLRVEPDAIVRAQYAESAEARSAEGAAPGTVPDWARGPARMANGEELELAASAGNLPEVERARALGLASIGLYRTELLYLVDSAPPSREALVKHYAAVLEAAAGAPVTFRLLNVDASLGVGYLHPEGEQNPALGRVGIRALLANEKVLRRQLQALLLAGHGHRLAIAIPFVTDCGELRRVKEVLFEERFELRKGKQAFQEAVEVGVVLETPAAMLGLRDLAREADFLMLNLDSLQQYLLATGRENAELAHSLERLHPFVLRALIKACAVARAEERPLTVFGVSAAAIENLPHLVGVGLRRFCLAPTRLQEFLEAVRALDPAQAAGLAGAEMERSCPQELPPSVAGYRHGYASP